MGLIGAAHHALFAGPRADAGAVAACVGSVAVKLDQLGTVDIAPERALNSVQVGFQRVRVSWTRLARRSATSCMNTLAHSASRLPTT